MSAFAILWCMAAERALEAVLKELGSPQHENSCSMTLHTSPRGGQAQIELRMLVYRLVQDLQEVTLVGRLALVDRPRDVPHDSCSHPISSFGSCLV